MNWRNEMRKRFTQSMKRYNQGKIKETPKLLVPDESMIIAMALKDAPPTDPIFSTPCASIETMTNGLIQQFETELLNDPAHDAELGDASPAPGILRTRTWTRDRRGCGQIQAQKHAMRRGIGGPRHRNSE